MSPWRAEFATLLLLLLPTLFVANSRADDSSVASSKPPTIRFIDRGEYVEDKKTGLLWQKDGAASGKMNYAAAAKYATKLKLDGMSGWRVPTAKELAGIFPAVVGPFKNSNYTKAQCCAGPHEFRSYWTCELDTRLQDYAYVYHWYARGGRNNCFASKNFVYVRCVHDPVRQDN